jgi:hypothetical protein
LVGEGIVNLTSQENDNWEEFYRLAALEVDGQKMSDRISTARKAITRRLGEIDGENDHQEERKRLEHALDTLKALTTETQAWKV